MSAKKNDNLAIVAGSQIPSISQYLVEGDPNDPSSRAIFMPWKAALDREGSFKMTHRAAKDAVVTSELEVIFLLIDSNTQCRCTTKEDRANVVCYSHDREYSYKGYHCKDECPYAEKHIEDYKLKSYSRPLRRTVYFLFRKVGSDEEFKLARFTSVLNNTDAFSERKKKFRMLLANMDVEHKYATANVAILESTSESPSKGVTIGRFGNKVAHAASIDSDGIAKVKEINDALAALISETADKQKASALRARDVLKETGELDRIKAKIQSETATHEGEEGTDPEGGNTSGEGTSTETNSEKPKDEKKAAAKPGKTPAGKKGAEKVEPEVKDPEPPVIEDDDDDLPF